MRRREFITLLGGAAAMWPLAARAQQPTMPVIGFLDSTIVGGSYRPRRGWLRQGLREDGFVEGRNVAIEFRWAEGKLDRLPALAADLVDRRVAAIIRSDGLPVASRPRPRPQRSRSSLSPAADPVQRLRHQHQPAGRQRHRRELHSSSPLNPKRLELLHELVPKPARHRPVVGSEPQSKGRCCENVGKAASRALGREMGDGGGRNQSEIDAAFATFVQAGAGALFVGTGPFYVSQGRQLVALAARHALPGSYGLREFVVAGGLMSYGASDTDAYSLRQPLCRPHSQGRQAGRASDPAADQVRAGHQLRHRQGAQARHSVQAARTRRRGDRIIKLCGA